MVLVKYTGVFIVLFCAFRKAFGQPSSFRILAPEIVCPQDENAVIEIPDHTVITLQTSIKDLEFAWTVRWAPLDTPTQLFTLLVWRTVRALELQLNGPQPDSFAFIINNTQLLGGVDYIFNITATSKSEDQNGTTKSFHIDNIKGDQKLIVDGRADKLSVFLVGGVTVFTDMQYILVAEVTSCSIQDYYFSWSVESTTGEVIDVDDISGRRLEIPPYRLRAGTEYFATSRVLRNSSLVTQTDVPFNVLYRGLEVYLNVNTLLVSVDKPFTLEAVVENHDHYDETPTFEWSCSFENVTCADFDNSDSEVLLLATGLPLIGVYEIEVLVNVLDEHASAITTVIIVEANLPVIQIQSLPKMINEGSTLLLVANASDVTPSCTLTWYFATKKYLNSTDESEKCDDCHHGEALSDSVTILSLEENFLNEITDFTNETEWRQVTAEMEAAEGRARFVAQCGCSLTFSCKTEGVVYADISFQINTGPEVADIKISPEFGTAMETVFRISRVSASDLDQPLRYTLLCRLGIDDIIVLGSNLEYFAVDTFLPYIDEKGTEIWAEVCDSLGACSISSVKIIELNAGEARSIELLVEDLHAYILRCEVTLLDQVVRSAIVTYQNAGQDEALAAFTKHLLEKILEVDHCLRKHQEYWTMLHWLASHGVDTSALTE